MRVYGYRRQPANVAHIIVRVQPHYRQMHKT